MFFYETSFKDMSVGKIPNDWESVKLSNAITALPGFPFSSNLFDKEKGIPLIRIRDLGKDKTETRYNGDYKEEYIVEKDDILVGMDGEFNVHFWKSSPGLLNQRVMKIIPKNERILNKLYLYYALQKPLKMFERKTSATTVKHLLANHFKLINIIVPTKISEQQIIAEVLTTVDEAIQKTSDIIAKTERLKKGLMQELLTKGIGHNEFKETQVGRIPKDWDVVLFGDVCNRRTEQTLPSGRGEHKFVGLGHIDSGKNKVSSYDFDFRIKSSKFKFYRGDILYGKLRPYLDKAVLVDFKGICSTDLLVLTSKRFKSTNDFLIYILHSASVLRHANSTTTGTNHPRTSWKAMCKYRFGLPNISEQQKITEILSNIDKKLELETSEKTKLKKIKQGFMDLLLTGKVRVKVS